jgi:hypothetical protein
MSAKKNQSPASPGLLSIVKSGISRGRWFVVTGIAILIFAVGWRLAWNRVRERVLAHDDYHLDARDIVISPLPHWIHCDLKKEAMDGASLDASLSILDEELTKRVANAFSLHPWVAKVHRVSKHHPARVEVELSYRQPVAMVEVSGGAFAVDAEGTVLPSKDFTPAEAAKYPRISRIDTHPIDVEGKSWGDPHVLGAAKIASLIGQRWHKLKLHRVLAPIRGGASRDVDGYTYELATRPREGTRSITRIIWGRPPGNEPTGEAPALLKLELLERIASQYGSLDRPDAPAVIDLRSGEAATTAKAVKAAAPVSPK